MNSRIFGIMRKEFIHIIRDPRTLIIVLAIPLIMLFLYGYALTLDVKNLSTVVYDQDKSSLSREFISKFSSCGYFRVIRYLESNSEIKEILDRNQAKLVINIPINFSKDIVSGKPPKVQTILDGVNSNTAAIALSYINAIVNDFREELLEGRLKVENIDPEIMQPIKYKPRIWYNETLRSINFLVPGIIVLILMVLSVLLTSMTIVGEREKGTMESLVVSPLKTYELAIGKLFPYVLIALMDIILVIAVGSFWFKVPVKGNVILLFFLSTLFLFCALGIGFFISIIARSGTEAFLIANILTMLPSVLLSGFVFPIKSMPPFVQFITHFIPAKYFLTIIRGIFLKGIGIKYLWPESVALLVFAFLIFGAGALRFKKTIE